MDYTSKQIRNVALLGHNGSGKTTLAEAMLFESGGINRRGTIEDGNTVSDYTPLEKERSNSLFSTNMHVHWRDVKINLIDTPGLDDFIGEVVAALKVADTAVMVINAQNGVEVGTEIMWEYIEEYKTPAIFAVNQLDGPKANFEQALEQLKNRFGRHVVPIQYPLQVGSDFNSIVDTLRMVVYKFPKNGGKPEKLPIPDSEKDKAQEWHNALVEAAAEENEDLMNAFFESGTLTEEELTEGLTIALSKQELFPVFCTSGQANMGSGRLMGFLKDIAPSPVDRPPAILESGKELTCNSDDKTTLFVYKTHTEPNVGNISYFKIYSGKLNSGNELVNVNTDETERFTHFFMANGKDRESVEQLIAGDMGVAVKLKKTFTNNTLNTKGENRKISPMHFPAPRIRTAVTANSKADVEKLSRALHSVQEEDPTIIVEQSQELKQTIIHGQGQLHLDMVKHRIEKNFGIEIKYIPPRIPYRETITKQSDAVYRHKKQSGGAGQFAEVHMRIEPYYEDMPDPNGLTVRKREVEELPWGGKLAYYWCIVGGSIDNRFSNAIKKGVMQKLAEGPMTGSPCQDVRVCIFDGKMHPVDSNDMAFQIAGTMVFRDAFQQANPKILEPLYDLEVLCDDEYMGEVMGDLQMRRSMIVNMGAQGHYKKIEAKVPMNEMQNYSSSLRSLTHGRAKFSRKFSGYQPAAPDIQQRLIASYKASEER